MFEFEVQGPKQIRLRIGRLHFRTWRSRLMVLPRGYRDSDVVYSVVGVNGVDEVGPYLATFYSEKAALACIEQLRSEGWGDLTIDLDSVYHRPQDWQFDR